MIMVVELRRILVNDLLCVLHRRVVSCVSLCLCRQSLRWRSVREQIFNCAFSSGSLVDGESRCKFPVCTCLYGIQQVHSEVLTVVADEIVGCSLLPHIMNRHFSCKCLARSQRKSLYSPVCLNASSLNVVVPTSKVCHSSGSIFPFI